MYREKEGDIERERERGSLHDGLCYEKVAVHIPHHRVLQGGGGGGGGPRGAQFHFILLFSRPLLMQQS